MPQEIFALDGYFQSRKYFENHEDIIRKQFHPSDEIINRLNHKYDEFYYQYCAIHVRRGDYVDLAYYHQIKMDYYEASMLKINQQTGIEHFVIFSDDIQWCKDNLKFKNTHFIENETNINDLYLMSLCSHNIMSNSTFSWWGAWLSPYSTKIVAPSVDKWYSDGVERTKCPQKWIRL